VFARQAFALCSPNQRTFLKFNGKQIRKRLTLTPLPVLMAQAGSIIGFGVNLGIEPLDQRVTMQPATNATASAVSLNANSRRSA
jgi:hypothetical protein